jgi:osmotically-inducible protein OsmY
VNEAIHMTSYKKNGSIITSKVKTALLSDPEVSGLDIHVEILKGRVHLNLNGLVDSITETQKPKNWFEM